MNDENVFTCRAYFKGPIYIKDITPSTIQWPTPRGVVVLLHGFPSWVTKNYDIAETLALLGYKVYVPHQAGLGLSKGRFEFLVSLEMIRELLLEIKQLNSNLKLSLVGHSWGGYLTLRNLDLVDGFILLLAPLAQFPQCERRELLVRNLFIYNQTDIPDYDLTRLTREFEILERDLGYQKWLGPQSSQKGLLMYGTRDEIIPADLIETFGQKVSSPNFTIKVYDDDHRLSRRRIVLKDIHDWVSQIQD